MRVPLPAARITATRPRFELEGWLFISTLSRRDERVPMPEA
jgi:hypothetical protein